MKRIAVCLVSLGMLAATSAQANYREHGQRFEGEFERGTSGPYGTDTYRADHGTRMRPDHHNYTRDHFMGGYDERTSGRKNYIGHKKTRYTGPGGPRVGRMHGESFGDRAQRRGWFRRTQNSPNLPGRMDAQSDNY